MRRSLLAGFGIAAVLVFAACTDSPRQQSPLAPTEPSPAIGDICSGSLASQIAKEQKALFTGANLSDLQDRFQVMKSQCPNVSTETLLAYIQKVIDYRGTVTVARAQGLVNHWGSVTNYITGSPLQRSHTVLLPGSVAPGSPTGNVRGGGAEVLDPSSNLDMTTFDGQAGVQISNPQSPSGPHLFTLDPSGCPTTTLRKATDDCYNLQVYPEVTVPWNPLITIGMCIHKSAPTGISHAEAGYGTEVLPPGASTFPWASGPSCTQTHAFINSWLGREAGPLGRALARTLDYLRPQPLFADDAGESGGTNDASPFGGVLTVVFAEDFNDPLANGPDVGDALIVEAQSPGYIQIQSGLGNLTDSVVVLSQALGNCAQCPTFRLLGTRVNASATDTIGTYEVTWQSLQNKPNVKEAPFTLLAHDGTEIARLSYVTESSQNLLKYNGTVVGSWVKDVAQSFRITVRLYDGDAGTTDYRTALAINNVTVLSEQSFVNTAAKTVSTMGYILTGIDAGIIASDNWLMKRLSDIP